MRRGSKKRMTKREEEEEGEDNREEDRIRTTVATCSPTANSGRYGDIVDVH